MDNMLLGVCGWEAKGILKFFPFLPESVRIWMNRFVASLVSPRFGGSSFESEYVGTNFSRHGSYYEFGWAP